MTGDVAKEPGLRPFQIEVAQAFFTTRQSSGFRLAGGAALIALGLVDRWTRDLDLFTAPGQGDVGQALEALESVCAGRSWDVRRVRVSETFVRVVVSHDSDSVEVDLALDATPGHPATASFVGPTLSPEDLAGRKLLALFSRAEARDFADVYALAKRYGDDRLLALAQEADAGFDLGVLADMLESVRRLPDDEIPAEDPAAVRAFALDWAARLRAGG